MKTVFSNSQLAHIWANQSQSMGKNSGNTFFFNGSKIWSYGSHYLLGNIIKVKGKKIALLNNKNYSATTCAQRNDASSALLGLMDSFYVPNPERLKAPENIKKMKDGVKNTIEYHLKRKSVKDKESIKYAVENIQGSLKECNAYLKLCGLRPVKVDAKTISKVKKHLESRLKRYHELNTPEEIERRAKNAEKREAKKQAALILENQQKIKDWREGAAAHLYGLPVMLRVQGDIVKTSHGAEVPLSDALCVLRELLRYLSDENTSMGDLREKFTGMQIGAFQVTTVANEEIIVIGCHHIPIEEAVNVLGKYL